MLTHMTIDINLVEADQIAHTAQHTVTESPLGAFCFFGWIWQFSLLT